MSTQEFTRIMNEYGRSGIPFLFLVDFEMKAPLIYRLDEVPANIWYDVDGVTNCDEVNLLSHAFTFVKRPIDFDDYRKKFDLVYKHLCYGDSYLTNLTIRTPIDVSLSLQEIFRMSRAKYRLLMDDRFVVFSPEAFVRIQDGIIRSFPMKGTIDAAVANAAEVILSDPKERAEHTTIVDLIRNDLSTVASSVRVPRLRYVDRLRTHDKELLQVSSEVCGVLPGDYRQRLGSILMAVLPAGSVSGAPKQKTISIIRSAEGEERGYYTGVFGLFDGERVDSAVMIRYIENRGGTYYYRSGGGITAWSDPRKEFIEAIDKVYVPIA